MARLFALVFDMRRLPIGTPFMKPMLIADIAPSMALDWHGENDDTGVAGNFIELSLNENDYLI